MDDKSLELAKQSLTVFAEVTSDAYADVRERLLGALSVPALTLEDMQRQTEVARQNRDLLGAFVTELPHAGLWLTPYDKEPSWRFQTSSVHDAKAIQTNTLWLRTFSRYGGEFDEGTYSPYFIVGRRQMDDKPKLTEILLQPAFVSHIHKKAAARVLQDVGTDAASELERISQGDLFRGYTEAETRALFNEATNSLCIDSGSQGSIKAKTFGSKRLSNITKRGALFARPGRRYSSGISDLDMATFGVFDYLNHLASAFGKVDELGGLLSSMQDIDESALEAAVLEDRG